MIEDFVAAEEVFLGRIFGILSQVPGLLSKSSVKAASSSRKSSAAVDNNPGCANVEKSLLARFTQPLTIVFHPLIM